LPNKWPGLKFLSAKDHGKYQKAAAKLAEHRQIHRVDLDVFFYRQDVPAAEG
jgi:hypothetical protein